MSQGWSINVGTGMITFLEAPANLAAIEVNEYATADINATDVWALGAFSGAYGYPSEIEFSNDRLWFMATESQPQSGWASRIGDYSFYGKSTPITDDDPFRFTLNSRGLNKVQDFVPLDTPVILTTGSEWKAKTGLNDVMTPSTVGFKPQSYIGSSGLQALMVGTIALYVGAKGSGVYELAYDSVSEGYASGDLLAFSGHLIEHRSLRDWAWQAVPNSMVWAVRDDGIMLSMTYKREQQVVGWMRHNTGGLTGSATDEFEQVCVIPEGDVNATYVVVKRTVNGQTVRYVERFADPAEDVMDYVGLDSALSYDGRNDTSTTMDLSTSDGWTPDDLLTLTASSATFSASNVGDWVIYGYGDEVPLRLTIDSYTSPTVVTVRPNSPVPTEYQAATTEWALAVDSVSGLDHLEGREVYALCDGYEQGPFTVASGEITLDPPAAVVHVGIGYDCDLETLTVNVAGGESVATRAKLIREVAIGLKASRSVHAGTDFDAMREYTPRVSEPPGSLPNLHTDNVKVTVDGQWGTNGRVCIREKGILPLTILSITPDTLFGGD